MAAIARSVDVSVAEEQPLEAKGLQQAKGPQRKFALPLSVVGPADVRRLLLELEQLDDKLRQWQKAPKTSRTLDDLAELNNADLEQGLDRQRLVAFLQALQERAPVIHISFAADPSAAFVAKIVEWMRTRISSFALVQIGLQPSIAAGCVVRTTSKVFDLSLGRLLRAQSHVLIEAMRTTDARLSLGRAKNEAKSWQSQDGPVYAVTDGNESVASNGSVPNSGAQAAGQGGGV